MAAPGDVVISADTVVYLDGKILEKPRDEEDAFRMLSALSGNTHAHLFSVGAGKGMLTVCTLVPSDFINSPVTVNLLAALLNDPENFTATEHISVGELRDFLQQTTAAGNKPEDVMNHFWEIDNKPVEDTLFWEQVGIDLSKLS